VAEPCGTQNAGREYLIVRGVKRGLRWHKYANLI